MIRLPIGGSFITALAGMFEKYINSYVESNFSVRSNCQLNNAEIIETQNIKRIF